jgi:WD40 repeat protein
MVILPLLILQPTVGKLRDDENRAAPAAKQVISGPRGVATSRLHPDGKVILCAGSGKTAQVWNILLDKERFTLSGGTRGINTVDYSARGDKILLGDVDGSLHVFDSITGARLLLARVHTSHGGRAVFLPGGDYALVSGEDYSKNGYLCSVKLWDLKANKEIRRFLLKESVPQCLAVSSDGRFALTGGGFVGLKNDKFVPVDCYARLWETATGQMHRKFVGHTNTLASASFSPDGRFILTASYDNSVRRWDVMTGKQVNRFDIKRAGWGVAFSPDGNKALAASNKDVILLDLLKGKEELCLRGHSGRVSSVGFFSNARMIFSAAHDGTIRIWNLSSSPKFWRMRSLK